MRLICDNKRSINNKHNIPVGDDDGGIAAGLFAPLVVPPDLPLLSCAIELLPRWPIINECTITETHNHTTFQTIVFTFFFCSYLWFRRYFITLKRQLIYYRLIEHYFAMAPRIRATHSIFYVPSEKVWIIWLNMRTLPKCKLWWCICYITWLLVRCSIACLFCCCKKWIYNVWIIDEKRVNCTGNPWQSATGACSTFDNRLATAGTTTAVWKSFVQLSQKIVTLLEMNNNDSKWFDFVCVWYLVLPVQLVFYHLFLLRTW